MSQASILDNKVSLIERPITRQLSEQEQYTDKRTRKLEAPDATGNCFIRVAILSTLLLRVASRTSFVLLGFYLGEHFTSAAVVAIVLEAFYISELLLAPMGGGLSDRLGRKPFLISAPLIAGGAALFFLVATLLFPHPQNAPFDIHLLVLLLMVLVGRLFEGAATALNTPTSLGYITETVRSSDKARARVLTAFEVATVAGLALAVPFGGEVSSLMGTWGFLVVLGLYAINGILIACFLKESTQRQAQVNAHRSLFASLSIIRYKGILTFLPAWLSINTLVGAWLTLCTIMLTYPEPAAHLRHPGQLLYGGFSHGAASLLFGGFGLLFLGGMGLWLLVLPHLRRTTVMLIGLGGLSISIVALTLINGLGENSARVFASPQPVLFLLLPMVVLGVLLLSGFTPASLNHMGVIAELLPGKRGAMMGLYSVVMGVGQLIGAALGGLSVDLGGFYGLMIFSVAMGLISLVSVFYMRVKGQDLIGNVAK